MNGFNSSFLKLSKPNSGSIRKDATDRQWHFSWHKQELCKGGKNGLWWSGMDAGFTAVLWKGNYSQVWIPGENSYATLNYHQNVLNAFRTASALKAASDSLPGAKKFYIAHSLGNILVSAAKQDYGLEYEKYVMLNAAIPGEKVIMAHSLGNMVVSSMMQDHGWPARFPDVPAVAVNFYSTGDEVLELYENNRIGILEGITSGWVQFSWHHQEIWKGRAFPVEGVGGTDWSGWDFDKVWILSLTLPVRVRRYTPEDAAALTP